MNRKDIINKLEKICARVDSPVHIPFESKYEGYPLSAFVVITEIYLFGSTRYKEHPNDIDLLVVCCCPNVFQNVLRRQLYEEATEKERIHEISWHQHHRFSLEYLTEQTLKKGMKKVDIHTASSIPESSLVANKNGFMLVWSRGKPNVKENLSIAKKNFELYAEELISLRDQLKEKVEENHVLELICRVITLPLEDKARIAKDVLEILPKRTVKEQRIREILKAHDFPEHLIIGLRSEGSKVWWKIRDEV